MWIYSVGLIYFLPWFVMGIDHRLGERRNKRNYSVRQRPHGKNCAERLLERNLIRIIIIFGGLYRKLMKQQFYPAAGKILPAVLCGIRKSRYRRLLRCALACLTELRTPDLVDTSPHSHIPVTFASLSDEAYVRTLGLTRIEVSRTGRYQYYSA